MFLTTVKLGYNEQLVANFFVINEVRYNREALFLCKFRKHQFLIKMFAQS